MNKFMLFFLSAVVVAAAATDLEDIMKVNVEELLADEARRKEIFDCLLDQAPCGEYQIYRDQVPEIVATNCGECTPEMKEKHEENVKFLLETYPEEYNQVLLKYGPQLESLIEE